jgi:hypothetical protein
MGAAHGHSPPSRAEVTSAGNLHEHCSRSARRPAPLHRPTRSVPRASWTGWSGRSTRRGCPATSRARWSGCPRLVRTALLQQRPGRAPRTGGSGGLPSRHRRLLWWRPRCRWRLRPPGTALQPNTARPRLEPLKSPSPSLWPERSRRRWPGMSASVRTFPPSSRRSRSTRGCSRHQAGRPASKSGYRSPKSIAPENRLPRYGGGRRPSRMIDRTRRHQVFRMRFFRCSN